MSLSKVVDVTVLPPIRKNQSPAFTTGGPFLYGPTTGVRIPWWRSPGMGPSVVRHLIVPCSDRRPPLGPW